MIYTNDRRGFTIVELLIVIVVIGILAAIVIVAYQGVTQRAKNTQRITGAQQSIKLIKAYRGTNNEKYPSNSTTCLTATCTSYDGNAETAVDPNLATNLKTVGTPPTSSAAAGKYYGIWYNTRAAGSSFDGDTSRNLLLMYWLDGLQQDCGVADVAVQGPGEAWARSTNKYSYSYAAENVTACWISV